MSINATQDNQENYDPKKAFVYELNLYHAELNQEVLKKWEPGFFESYTWEIKDFYNIYVLNESLDYKYTVFKYK